MSFLPLSSEMTCTSSYPSSGSTSRLCFAMALEITAGVLSWLVNYLGNKPKLLLIQGLIYISCGNVKREHLIDTGTQIHIFIYQYALVEIPVAMLQADSYDACILGLGVISWGLTRGARRHGREGDGASVGAGGPRERGRCGSHGDTGSRRAGVHGVKWSTGGGFW